MATIGILHQRTVGRDAEAVARIQHAMQSAVIIGQAKVVLALRRNITFEDAFAVLRSHARTHGRALADVAREVAEGVETARGLVRERDGR